MSGNSPAEIVPGIGFTSPLDDADAMFAALCAELRFTDEYVDFGDGPVKMPRRTAWHGDPGAVYTYEGLTHAPLPWPRELDRLRARLNARLDATLNSCLAGMYDDGTSSVDWHADDEPELRDRIVSVSLGATRTFTLRDGVGGAPFDVPLVHGSVLVMTVESQRRWQHAVPAEPGAGPRLNLTFRTIAVATPVSGGAPESR
jgi:alkylated DNA repair dioxygenase AlkB